MPILLQPRWVLGFAQIRRGVWGVECGGLAVLFNKFYRAKHIGARYCQGKFPAFSWVLSLWPAVRCPSIRAINRYRRHQPTTIVKQCRLLADVWFCSALGKPDVIAFTSVIQMRFAIRVYSVPSRKLGPARTRPRVVRTVCPSVCDVEVSLSHRLEFCENNFTAD